MNEIDYTALLFPFLAGSLVAFAIQLGRVVWRRWQRPDYVETGKVAAEYVRIGIRMKVTEETLITGIQIHYGLSEETAAGIVHTALAEEEGRDG